MKTKKLNPAIIELAAKYDRLANEANFDESKHPRADDGKFTSGGGGGSGGAGSGKKEGRSAGGLKTVMEQSAETEDLFNRSVDTGDEFSVGGTYNPFQTVTDSAFDALKSRANIDDDDMDEPVIRSIVSAISVSSARDALKMKSKSPVGYAIAIAHVRANEAAKLLNKAKSIDEIEGVRNKVLADNKFSVAR